MAQCRICGARYEDRGTHVVVVELRETFDKVECAEIALRNARREKERAVDPFAHPQLDEAAADEAG